MIDVEEHIYNDDPKSGHPDVRTELKNANYFFIGNGLILGAVQFAPESEGTPVGLIIMDPDQLKMKREALTFEPDLGFSSTFITIDHRESDEPEIPSEFSAGWITNNGIPTTKINWIAGTIQVSEQFFCADRSEPAIARKIILTNIESTVSNVLLKTGIPGSQIELPVTIQQNGQSEITLIYSMSSDGTISIFQHSGTLDTIEAENYWQQQAFIKTGSALLDHHFSVASHLLPSVISKHGVVDASIWQYRREWVRDHSFMAIGLTLTGFFDQAAVLLKRLVEDFVSEEGDCFDSSEKRAPDEVELDQNGALLYALQNYALWTGDYSIIKSQWDKIKKIADYPFKDEFRHEPSGMFCNTRDYWERHQAHGIQKGIEFCYQFFPAYGLTCATSFARALGEDKTAAIWEGRAADLKDAILNHPEFAMYDQRGFIKRRSPEGGIQESIIPSPDCGLPAGVPLASKTEHLLNPDTSLALPIALGFIEPDSEIALATMKQMELLWNQMWDHGGHGRYNQTSEPDSAGPWPFSSIIVARAAAETGDFENVMRTMKWLDSVPGSIAGSWFEMYGERIAPPYPQNGIIPWTWAEIIMLFMNHLLGIKPGPEGILIRPKIPPGANKWDARFKFRDIHIQINIVRDLSLIHPSFKTDGGVRNRTQDSLLLNYPEKNITVDVRMP